MEWIHVISCTKQTHCVKDVVVVRSWMFICCFGLMIWLLGILMIGLLRMLLGSFVCWFLLGVDLLGYFFCFRLWINCWAIINYFHISLFCYFYMTVVFNFDLQLTFYPHTLCLCGFCSCLLIRRQAFLMSLLWNSLGLLTILNRLHSGRFYASRLLRKLTKRLGFSGMSLRQSRGKSCAPSCHTSFLYTIEYCWYNWLRIETMYLLDKTTSLIMDGRVGKRWWTHVVHAELRVPLAIEVIDFETPLFLMFELIEHCLQVAAVGTVGSEILDEFVRKLVLKYFGVILFIADEIRIRHKPFICHWASYKHGNEERDSQLCGHSLDLVIIITKGIL